MKRVVIVSAIAASLAIGATRIASAPWHPPAQTNGRVVLQLFTSQGCSSCPPADELLSAIGRENSPAIIPLAYHVDYWNSLGWSDPFSSAAWSERQREYSGALRANVYTPQLVVNGRREMVGSVAGAVYAAIDAELQQPTSAAVGIDRVVRSGSGIHVEVSAVMDRAVAERGARLVVVLFENGVTTEVRRGENSGRTLVNDAIVRWESNAIRIDRGGAAAGSLDIPLSRGWNADHLGIAAFAQENRSLAIHGGTSRSVPRS
jgi:hypothetical protein